MSELFDQSFFDKLNHIQLATHIRMDQGQNGSRKSSAKGSSVEFSDFREYILGDDIRRVDWNVYGRFEKLYVKRFMEEKEANYHIFIDGSASMDFGEQKKSVMAQRLAAVFAWVVMRQLDRVELLSLAGGRLDPLAPAGGRGNFGRVLDALESMTFSGTAGIYEGVRRASFPGRGVSILLSDFLESEGVEEAVRYLVYQKQEVMLVQILAREELAFAGEGTVALCDAESKEELRVTLTRKTIRSYQDALQKHQRSLRALSRRYGCAYLPVVSDEELEKIVFETLKKKGIWN